MTIPRKRKRLPLLIFIVIMVVGLSFTKTRVAIDFPFASQEYLKAGLNLPQTWSFRGGEGLGEYGGATLWGWPMDFIYGLGANIGLTFGQLEFLLGFFAIFVIGILSTYKLSRYLQIKNWILVSLFYLLNSYILLIVDGGQFSIGLAYSWFPMAYLSVIQSLDGGIKGKIKAGLAVSLLGFSDIRFVYILFILLSVHFIFNLFYNFKNLFTEVKKWLKSAVPITLIFFAINFYWILPIILVQAPLLPATYNRVSQTSFLNFVSWKHSLLLLQPHWYKNVFGKVTPILPEFVLIPILAFVVPLYFIIKNKFKDFRRFGFWLFVAGIGVFLVKGANPPMGSVYSWLFTVLPGFSLFRDSSKFFFLVALGYSVLFGFAFDSISELKAQICLNKYILNPIVFIFAAYVFFLARPVWTGSMTGTLSKPSQLNEYEVVNSLIEKDKNFGRVLWIPSRAILGYADINHTSVEASRLLQKRVFSSYVVGSYEQNNFIREGKLMGELLNVIGVNYMSYPYPDTRREELKPDNIDYYYSFLGQISGLPWVEKKLTDSPVPLLKLKNNPQHFFVVGNTWSATGGTDIFNYLADTPGFSLSDNALIFTEQTPGLGEKISKLDYIKPLNFGSRNSYAKSVSINQNNVFFPATLIDFEPNETGWWKRETSDFLWVRNFLQEKYRIDNQDFDYGGGYAFSEGNNKITITSDIFSGEGTIWVRALTSSKGGIIRFSQGDNILGSVVTLVEQPEKITIKLTGNGVTQDQYFEYDKAQFEWFALSKKSDNQPVTIETSGELNIINAVALLPNNEAETSVFTTNIKNNTGLGNTDENTTKERFMSEDTLPEISYKRVSPTHYKIKISQINKPITLAFSENYDDKWQMWKTSNPEIKTASIPLYGLINGFPVYENGEYDIYYSPQKYVLPGLVVSGTLLLIILCILFLIRNK